MYLTAKQICVLLHLPGIGKKVAHSICTNAYNKGIMDYQDLFEFITSIHSQQNISRMPKVTRESYDKAIQTTEGIFDNSHKQGIEILPYHDPSFPTMLKDIPDPPVILNFKGNYRGLNDKSGIAIIGTRNPTQEGLEHGIWMGEYYARKGYNIVSGLAKGCDTAAHTGALNLEGFTTAFVAHGLDMVYPKENMSLAEEIIEKGGVLASEYFVGTGTYANHFVERDRLQAGLSKACVVIQTNTKGGTMHTVQAILDGGKPLAAIKYGDDIISDEIKGNRMLIEKGNTYALTKNNIKDFDSLII